ncbi:MAG: hypothetical protein AB7D05_02250 [Mangrovibacterium sp.]
MNKIMPVIITQNQCLAIILKKKEINDKLFIAVGGLSRSGKSTFIANMQEKLNSYNVLSATIPLDCWILPVEKRKPDMTVRERYQYDQLTKDLEELIHNEELSFFPYYAHTRSVSTMQTCISIKKATCIFIDGVIALDHPYIKRISSLKVYTEEKEEVRKARFIRFYKLKDMFEKDIQSLYEERQKDEFPFIVRSKESADYIIQL